MQGDVLEKQDVVEVNRGAEQGAGADAEVEDVKANVQMKRPYTPTQHEIEEHMPLHIPYRPLCPHCVAGRGASGHHIASDKSDRLGVTISV